MAALELFPYQVEGVEFLLTRPAEMNRKPHRLLADEQGLGKTAQAIAATVELKAETVLVICPASVKYNWRRQMEKWGLCNEADVHIVEGEKAHIPDDARIIVVNYELVIVDFIYKQLMARTFKVLILDEAHRLKNMDAARSKRVLGKIGVVHRCFWKFLLTGTPVPNRPIEFFIVLATLAPELIAPYTKWVDFGRHFCSGWKDEKGGLPDPETGVKWNFKGASNIDELSKRIRPFMLRRTLKEVYWQLPDMMEEIVYLNVDIKDHPEVKAQMADMSIARTEDFDPELEMPQATIRRIVGESKVPQVFQYLCEQLGNVDDTNKILVFAYHREVIKQLRDKLEGVGVRSSMIQGGVSAKRKQEIIDNFISNPKQRVLLSQITAGGEGIDGLQQVCSDVVFAEIDWSEGGMRQAKSRLHRIGQTKVVRVRYLIADSSIEAIMAAVLERKSSVINKLMKGKTDMSLEQALTRIAVAIEDSNKLLAQQLEGGSAPVAEKPAKADKAETKKDDKKKDDKKKKVTYEQLKDAAKALVDSGEKAAAQEIIKSFGVEKLAQLKEDDWAEAIEKFQAAMPEAGSSDDDI